MARHHVHLFSAFPDAVTGAGAPVPEWVHLVPAGTFRGVDGRGPYTLADAAGVITTSMAAGAKLPIDENHAIDLAAPKGEPSPARGWIVELDARADGIWGRVEWTAAGRALMADRAYRGISPALLVEKSGSRVLGVLRASLTNDPNLSDLTTLHHRSDQDMDFITRMRAALGLPADTSEAAILAAISVQKTSLETHAADPKLAAVKTALQAAGLDYDTVTAAQITNHLQAAGGDAAQLRSTVIELQTSLTLLQQNNARGEANRVIDAAISAGKVGLKPLRDHYITRHMADPEAVAKEIAAMPDLHSGGFREVPTPGATGAERLSAGDREVCELMGLDPVKYAETLKAHTQETL